MEKRRLIIWCDGLVEPRNPGGYGCYGWIARDGHGVTVGKGQGCIGNGAGITNNVAEYSGALEALRWAYKNGYRDWPIEVRSDSQLMVRQVNREYACRAPLLIPLLARTRKAQELMDLTFIWIPRAQNEEADALSRLAYEEATGKIAPVRG